MFARSHFRPSIHPVASAIAVGCVRIGVMFAVCTPRHYCYRRGLSSQQGHVRPCVHPVATATTVGFVRIGVMSALGRCYRWPLQGLETLLLLLSLYRMSTPSLRTGFTPRDEQVLTWAMFSRVRRYRLSLSGSHPVLGAVPKDADCLWYGGVTRRILRILLRWVLCVIINNQWPGVLVSYVGLRYRR